MKIIIIIALLFTTVLCQAQTKVIAHKSHSGSKGSFSKAYQQKLFDINRSNFGLPGNRNIVILDTIIAVNNFVTILKMRESDVCYPYGTSYKDLKESNFKIKTDTLVNHNVLNRNNTVTFIKSSGKHIFSIPFRNPIEEVVFIGFRK